jgi:hypothetical protein
MPDISEAVNTAVASAIASLPTPAAVPALMPDISEAVNTAVASAIASLPTPAAVPAPEVSTKLCINSRVSFPAGDYTTEPAQAESASIGTITNIPGKLPMKINTSALTENSMIFLTPIARGPTIVAISDIQVSTGQFTIAAGSVCTVNWMIVN